MSEIRVLPSVLVPTLILLAILPTPPAMAADVLSASRSEFAIGKRYYLDGEFKKAAAHFERALATDPNDAGSYYWMGMAFQILADLSAPMNGRYRSKARLCLSKAMELAPGRSDFRLEFFNSLLEPSSRSATKQAADILRSVAASDPDYAFMREKIARAGKGKVRLRELE
jgi:tetratricopeptide (TPR) repeat protein